MIGPSFAKFSSGAERGLDAEGQAAAWDLIRAKFSQHATVNWKPRLTLELHIESWTSEGLS
jgi:hypothetical protein